MAEAVSPRRVVCVPVPEDRAEPAPPAVMATTPVEVMAEAVSPRRVVCVPVPERTAAPSRLARGVAGSLTQSPPLPPPPWPLIWKRWLLTDFP